jgi:hypothetical protein
VRGAVFAIIAMQRMRMPSRVSLAQNKTFEGERSMIYPEVSRDASTTLLQVERERQHDISFHASKYVLSDHLVQDLETLVRYGGNVQMTLDILDRVRLGIEGCIDITC